MKEYIERMFKEGKLTVAGVKAAVKKKWITSAESKGILNSK